MRYFYVKKASKQKKPAVVVMSVLLLLIGTLTLLWSFYPIVTFQLASVFSFSRAVSPLPKSVLADSLKKGLPYYSNDMRPYYSSYLKDFTRVGEWFPQKPQVLTYRKNITSYTLTIPRLGVLDATVMVGGEDLSKSLVQYGDQVLPGEIGNVAVLGHSTLPQLYKNKDYKSIFTYLPSIERGDKIRATVNGFTYEYVVYDMFTVDPDEIWVLDPKADESLLTLISCVPPGTYWKRLIVRARMVGL